jgi:hypothetical protein
MEALAAIPEPEGVTLYRLPPHLGQGDPDGLTVEVAGVAGSAGLGGRSEERALPVAVELDRAHDLSWRGPEVYVWPQEEAWQRRKDAPPVLIRRTWTVIALGFIEQEARTAFDAVCNAIDGPPGKRLPQRRETGQGMMGA